jgi:hypothetical protein
LLWAYGYELPELEPELVTPTRNAAGEIVSITVNFSLDRRAANLVPWQPSVFIGENPTSSQRIVLSNTLKRLEERGLIYRYSVLFKDDMAVQITPGNGTKERIRTTHFQLSAAGDLFAASLRGELDLEEHSTAKTRRQLEARAAGLKFALLMLDRERLKHVDNDTAHRRLEQIAEKLEVLTEYEFIQGAGHASNSVSESLRELQALLNGTG